MALNENCRKCIVLSAIAVIVAIPFAVIAIVVSGLYYEHKKYGDIFHNETNNLRSDMHNSEEDNTTTIGLISDLEELK